MKSFFNDQCPFKINVNLQNPIPSANTEVNRITVNDMAVINFYKPPNISWDFSHLPGVFSIHHTASLGRGQFLKT